jgi:intergrase/recombinase
MEEQIMNIALSVLAILLPALAALSVELIRRKLGVETMIRIQKELETKQELAALAVQFVEQVYTDYKGEEKYQAAARWLATQAIDRGINITADEIQGLIEATLKAFKDAFGEEWNNAVK